MELKGHRVAGGLYVADSVLALALGLGLSFISTGLGLALLIIKDESRLEGLRFVIFAWVLISIVIVLIGAGSLGYWGPLFSSLLFGCAIAGLMLNNLSQKSITILAGVGTAGMFLPVILALV